MLLYLLVMLYILFLFAVSTRGSTHAEGGAGGLLMSGGCVGCEVEEKPTSGGCITPTLTHTPHTPHTHTQGFKVV